MRKLMGLISGHVMDVKLRLIGIGAVRYER
jgi:hypothetical protein